MGRVRAILTLLAGLPFFIHRLAAAPGAYSIRLTHYRRYDPMSALPDVAKTVKVLKSILSEGVDLASEKRRFQGFFAGLCESCLH